jgi:hypothetical protein
VERFASLEFPNPKTVGGTSWTGDQTVARPLPTQDNTKTVLYYGNPKMRHYSSKSHAWKPLRNGVFFLL